MGDAGDDTLTAGNENDRLIGGLSFTIIAQANGVTAAQLFDVANFGL